MGNSITALDTVSSPRADYATINPMPIASTGRIAAVIVTHNRVELLQNSLKIVAQQTHPVDHIIVVDNGDDPAVESLVTDIAGERAVYLGSKHNLGGAGGFALGFLTALRLGADAVWCADDDGQPEDENVLATLLHVAEKYQLDEVSPVVCNAEKPDQLAFPLRRGTTWHRFRSELGSEDFLAGIASLFNGALISADAMQRIGVPDLRLFIRGDEVEYHRRLVRSGLKFGTCLTAAYLHPDGSDEFKPILGGRMHTQYPDNEGKRFFTYRNRGYLMNQPGMRRLLPQEYARFGWFFLIQRKDPQGFVQWLKLHRMGRSERFERP
ncbi:glycosyltransferase [Corynebacterium ulcerans]|uniref:Glycosyltransferase n=2 Tax=Corynebacterium ulcerans TaxID=65058 RepID=A0ABD0BHP1_CORUL|nr:hypothetical protein CULC0102_0153 [Corynebacterium ulcerans 0102]GJJ33388.1 glycosyltransferase [Corynebacterium ulcerans]GJJ36070.1 glycosyltransferase [Corynebacterium ulcerans]GJJ38738.1 glycosyltransferase [Corynebacterium ulcerans]GJJ40113.1 glycosyltransferase [Corynebacterium ulcerans]